MELCGKLLQLIPGVPLTTANQIIIELQGLIGEKLKAYIAKRFGSHGNEFLELVIHMTWIKIWQSARHFRNENTFSAYAWIFAIGRNTALNLIRDQRKLDQIIYLETVRNDDGPINGFYDLQKISRKIKQPDIERSMEDDIIDQESQQAFNKILTPKERDVFCLFLSGFSPCEIASMLKITKQRVTQYFSQIRKKRESFNG